ncbi:hypothetical protein GCM10010468_23100 [Actinocorallia longicatena]|uniref:Uncharacterized protein n=1 Tax=Actinocorallia longicatena TaxID=111803 RepID=A0ABP6Q6F2_9ACTN
MQQPTTLGYVFSTRDAHTIAAPLLVAAALSLAGVVAGASDATFRWPGPTLLLLVITSLLLVASIQLQYLARQFLYSRADIDDWYPPGLSGQKKRYQLLCKWQGDDYATWKKFNDISVMCFNVGTVFLGSGIFAALLPADGNKQPGWRLVAACLVLAASVADVVWTLWLYRWNTVTSLERGDELANLEEEEETS